MLVGELFVTDGLVTYMSTFSRYKSIDVAMKWKHRKNAFLPAYGLLLVLPISILNVAVRSFCLTAPLEDEMHPVITTCPLPPSSVHDMSRVGLSYASDNET